MYYSLYNRDYKVFYYLLYDVKLKSNVVYGVLMDNTNNTYVPPSKDQILVSAMNKGCTEDGANIVYDIVSEYPQLDLQDVIKEVAAAKGKDDKNSITGKLFNKAESDKKAETKVVQQSNAPQPATKGYTHR